MLNVYLEDKKNAQRTQSVCLCMCWCMLLIMFLFVQFNQQTGRLSRLGKSFFGYSELLKSKFRRDCDQQNLNEIVLLCKGSLL